MPRNVLGNEWPEQSIAVFTADGGRAVVETAGGKVFSYHESRPEGERFVEERFGFRVCTWMQSTSAIRMWPAGEYPFTELEKRLRNQPAIDRAERWFMATLDPELTVNLRQRFLKSVGHLLEDDEIRKVVEPALMNIKQPEQFDTTHAPTEGHAGRILQAMIAKWQAAAADAAARQSAK